MTLSSTAWWALKIGASWGCGTSGLSGPVSSVEPGSFVESTSSVGSPVMHAASAGGNAIRIIAIDFFIVISFVKLVLHYKESTSPIT
jgi:hypothetical protein